MVCFGEGEVIGGGGAGGSLGPSLRRSDGFFASYFFLMLAWVTLCYLTWVFMLTCCDALIFVYSETDEFENIVIPRDLLPWFLRS